MLLLLASLYEFTLFLKIVLWIAVPLIIISLVITTFVHYRQKKKNAANAEQPISDMPAHEVAVSRLQKEVLHYKRLIKELQHTLGFARDVRGQHSILSPGAQIPDAGSTANGKEGTSSRALENNPVGGAQVQAAYLQDMVEEQKSHVLFLQNQLENRIKSYHELEQQLRETSLQLEKTTASFEHAQHLLEDAESEKEKVLKDNEQLERHVLKLQASLKELQHQHNQSLKILDAGKNPANPVNPATVGEDTLSMSEDNI
jgi:DNA repair exonuclease SbcCD ATPase subunit